jgi:hypothetical protein
MIRLIKRLLILTCIGIYGYSAVDTNTGQPHSISIDTDKPLSIVWPFETAIVGDNGEKGLRIGPNIGRGWRDEAGGQASYRFYVPEDGKYKIWAYCLWFDECANAVFAKIDDLDKAIIGNDPVYKQWHWVRGFEVHLKKGTHTLILSNHSDHISLQKILFTNSVTITPEDCSLVFSDIFYDGFDGCDQGNFKNWQIVSGQWLVRNPDDQINPEQNILTGKSEENSFIIYNNNDWSDYSFNSEIKHITTENAEGTIGICFGVKDVDNYHQLKFCRTEKSDVAKMQICRLTNDETQILTNFEVPFEPDEWHQVEITPSHGGIIIKLDDVKPVETSIDQKVTGGIGFRLEGNIEVYFDNVHVRQIAEIEK